MLGCLTMKRTKDITIYARVDKGLAERLQRAATRSDIPASQIIRAAVKAELDRIEGKGKIT